MWSLVTHFVFIFLLSLSGKYEAHSAKISWRRRGRFRSSFSKARSTVLPNIDSFSGIRTAANRGCSRHFVSEILKKGLKIKTCSRKSMASGELFGYFSLRLVRGVNLNCSKYSRAFVSVTKLLSASFGDPMI